MGLLLRVLSVLVAVICGLWGLFACVGLIFVEYGLAWACIAALLTPATLLVTPVYAGIAHGYWLPALLIYGGAALSFALNRTAAWLEEA